MEENNEKNQDLSTPPVQEMRPDNTPKIVGAILLAGVMIAAAILLKDSPARPAPPGDASQIEFRPVSPDEHILGNPDSQIKIIEYSDTECPFCKAFHTTMHGVVATDSEVAWIYRHFPIATLHPRAFHEAEATECATELGGNEKFWQYIDELFKRTESNNRLDPAELPKIAKDIGLDLNAFNTCLEGGKYIAKIQADMEDGNKAGARGTPYSLIVSKNKITTARQKAILDVIKRAEYVTFDSANQYVMSLNGALPSLMVSGIVQVLLK